MLSCNYVHTRTRGQRSTRYRLRSLGCRCHQKYRCSKHPSTLLMCMRLRFSCRNERCDTILKHDFLPSVRPPLFSASLRSRSESMLRVLRYVHRGACYLLMIKFLVLDNWVSSRGFISVAVREFICSTSSDVVARSSKEDFARQPP